MGTNLYVRYPFSLEVELRLTQHSDYALRVLMHLALESPNGVAIPEIADAFGISQDHLTKVAGDLRKLGVIETQRGRGGGLKLAKPAGDISVGAVVRALEGFDVVECFDRKTNTCILTKACGLQDAMEEATDAFLKVLDGYSLSSLLKNPRRMRQLIEKGPKKARPKRAAAS